MCTGIETATLLAYASAAAAAVGTVVSYQTAENNADYQDQMNKRNEEQIVDEGLKSKNDQERARQQQHQQATSEVNAYQTEAMRQRAELEALIGEYGGGNTSIRNLSSLGSRQGQDLATLKGNAQAQGTEMGFRDSAQLASISSKVNGLTPGQRGSKLGLGAGLASTALTAGQRYQSIQNPKPSSGVK